jgi:regulator of protease activity HflC (stomatin/prohibitin superfamily)
MTTVQDGLQQYDRWAERPDIRPHHSVMPREVANVIAVVIVYGIALGIVVAVAVSFWRRFFDRVTILEYQRGLLFHKGRFARLIPPGAHWIRRGTNVVHVADMRESRMLLARQDVLSADNTSSRMNVMVRYRVIDPVVALTSVDNYLEAAYAVVHTVLREVVARTTSEQLLARRADIQDAVVREGRAPAAAIGIELTGVDVSLESPTSGGPWLREPELSGLGRHGAGLDA